MRQCGDKTLTKGGFLAIVPAVQQKVPTLRLPTDDYAQMLAMSDKRLICVLRSAVLAPERVGRFVPRPPAEHDAYRVFRAAGGIDVQLYAGGNAVFCCRFVPHVVH